MPPAGDVGLSKLAIIKHKKTQNTQSLKGDFNYYETNIHALQPQTRQPTLSPDLKIKGINTEGCVTHGLLQTDLSELPHSRVEQSLQGLLPLLKSCDPLSLQLAVLAVLNIYAASGRPNENIAFLRSHTFHRKAPQTDEILLLAVHLTCLNYDSYIRNILVWF